MRFRHRNELGLDLAIEALRAWRQVRGARPDDLLTAARVVRAEKLMRPYLEALLCPATSKTSRSPCTRDCRTLPTKTGAETGARALLREFWGNEQ